MIRRIIRVSLLPTVVGAALVLGGCTTDGTPVADGPAQASQYDSDQTNTGQTDTGQTDTGSGADTSRTPSPETTTTSPEASGHGLSEDKENEAFIRTLQQLGVAVPDEAEYIAVGRQACADIRGGKPFIDVALNLSLGLGPVSNGSVVGAVIGVFCPDQQSKISTGG